MPMETEEKPILNRNIDVEPRNGYGEMGLKDSGTKPSNLSLSPSLINRIWLCFMFASLKP